MLHRLVLLAVLATQVHAWGFKSIFSSVKKFFTVTIPGAFCGIPFVNCKEDAVEEQTPPEVETPPPPPPPVVDTNPTPDPVQQTLPQPTGEDQKLQQEEVSVCETIFGGAANKDGEPHGRVGNENGVLRDHCEFKSARNETRTGVTLPINAILGANAPKWVKIMWEGKTINNSSLSVLQGNFGIGGCTNDPRCSITTHVDGIQQTLGDPTKPRAVIVGNSVFINLYALERSATTRQQIRVYFNGLPAGLVLSFSGR